MSTREESIDYLVEYAALRGLDYRIREIESKVRGLQGNEEARLEKLGTKCVVKDCANHTHQGMFVGLLCAPCHSFVSGGDGGGYSQVARNTQREWIGLTDEDKTEILLSGATEDHIYSLIEAKLKEKNT